ncbi:MAG: hypothetical protein M3245_03340 [Actinomycetota bacterium]|nr:hypothetical protein [Actinomycetota bacterium]
MSGDQPRDGDALAPVEGIALERYAAIAVALFGLTADELDARAESLGVPPGRLNAVAEEWNRRMAADPEVARRYSEAYQAALRDAGVRTPDITLEQYADIMRQAQGGRPLAEVLASFGLDLQTFAMVSQHWTERMGADRDVAMRFAGLLGLPRVPPS